MTSLSRVCRVGGRENKLRILLGYRRIIHKLAGWLAIRPENGGKKGLACWLAGWLAAVRPENGGKKGWRAGWLAGRPPGEWRQPPNLTS